MKKLTLAVLGVVVSTHLASIVLAGTVNPTSNVLADTAATADTIVLRDSSGNIDGAQLSAGSVVTAKLATSSVTTAKTYLDLKNDGVVCVTSTKRLGQCSSDVVTGGTCTCQ